MTKRKKRIVRLKQAKGEVSFKLVGQVLEDSGYKLQRIVGSHFHFDHQFYMKRVIPVHLNKVKNCYVKDIIKDLGL